MRMRVIYLGAFAFYSCLGCATEQVISCDNGLSCAETQYPYSRFPELMADYEHQVRLGYPDENGAKIWVKGSSVFPLVGATSNSGESYGSATLVEPFFTHIFSGLEPNSTITLEFKSVDGRSKFEKVTTSGLSELFNITRDYSVAFYGCFQPFTAYLEEGELQSDLYNLPNNFPVQFMQEFANTVAGEDSDATQAILPNTKLVVGSGDQVYMDAGYGKHDATRTNKHPLSAWTTVEPRPKLIRRPQYFDKHVQLTYRAFGSFESMNKSFRSAPQVNVWDDHEIRDGWGSQGDEYIGNSINPKFSAIFSAAKAGFIHHQYSAGPGRTGGRNNAEVFASIDDLLGKHIPMYQTFSVGNFEGFAFDLRTMRNSVSKTVLGEDQKTAFTSWLDNLGDNQKVIIVSSMPVFLKNNDVIEGAVAKLKKGLKDDFEDGWGSKSNVNERRWLVQRLLKARIERKIMPILVSGDYHKGAMSEIWYGKENENACLKKGEKSKEVFGYEILASGLYHEGLARGIQGKGFRRGEAQRVGQHFVNKLEVPGQPEKFCLDPHVEISVVTENFGGLVDEADPASPDKLRLVAGWEDDGKVRVYEMQLNWNKPFNPSDEKDYRGIQQNMSRIFSFLPFVDDKFHPIGTRIVDEFTLEKLK